MKLSLPLFTFRCLLKSCWKASSKIKTFLGPLVSHTQTFPLLKNRFKQLKCNLVIYFNRSRNTECLEEVVEAGLAESQWLTLDSLPHLDLVKVAKLRTTIEETNRDSATRWSTEQVNPLEAVVEASKNVEEEDNLEEEEDEEEIETTEETKSQKPPKTLWMTISTSTWEEPSRMRPTGSIRIWTPTWLTEVPDLRKTKPKISMISFDI